MQVGTADPSTSSAAPNGSTANGSTANGTAAPATAAVRVAVVFAGRQSSGGHNVIWGLHEYLKGTGSTVRSALRMT